MSDIEMEPPSPSCSYKTYQERIFRPVTPSSLPPEPTTDCGKRRAAMTRLKNQETMIEGYQKFLTTFKQEKDEHGVHKQLQESLKETIAARDQLLDQLKEKYPDITSKTSGKYLKLSLNSHEDQRDLVNFMDEDKKFQFYVITPKDKKPIKIVIKGLPGCTKPDEFINDLEHQGYSDCSCNQLISKRTKLPYCINCEAYGHTACYTKCPKPRKGTPISNRNNKAFASNNGVEGISFANMVSGKPKINDSQATNNKSNNSERQSHSSTPPTDEISSSDFQDLISLFKIVSNIFKQFPKLKQIIPELKKTKNFQKQACMLLEVLWD
ncbi:uncharacterized protein TNCV_4097791 [Trichonephila clavipes]|nr:uncharacterized protein TNCV_4097791 [Trichonephila clavipes]